MAYRYSGPSLAAGGTLVKKTSGKRIERKAKPSIFTPEEWAERMAPGWDERGWHGGGMHKIRKTQRSKPSKGNSRTGRFAHPSLLRVTK